MDRLVETGSTWFCTAAHAVGSSTFEMQTCGDDGSRYAVGLATLAAVCLLLLFTLTRLVAGRATRASE